ncbi:MAG: PadR family transcriptional regulator [Bacteroidetes bacterium]|nr:PadR family transcriptional regulator [Bacteroidota bacterium]
MNLISRAEELLLLAIWTLQDQSYGAMLRDYLVEATNEDWSIGVVYNTLDRLARKGFVRTSLGDPTPERGGRAKRYFHLTAEGVESLERIRTVQNSLWSDLPILNLRNA